jgi:hypothetical protein
MRSYHDDLGLALDRATDDLPPKAVAQCRRVETVSPTIAIAAPKIVLVGRGYQDRPHRIRLRLGTTSAFTGTGTLDSNQRGTVRIYSAREGGNLIGLPRNISGAQLSGGVAVWVEGVAASAATDGTVLTLALAGGAKTITNSPAQDTMTCVVARLTLCQYKPAPGGADPVALADQIAGQRNLHLQTADNTAGRALLIVEQMQPADYAGQVTLRRQNNRVQIFPYANEVAAGGQAATVLPLTVANAGLGGNNGKFWVEGARFSDVMLDTGFALEVHAVPAIEADRANLTVVKAVFDIHDLPTTEGGTQARIADGSKLNPGRSLMAQDGGNHFDRARIVLKRVEPGGMTNNWTGNLEMVVWDVTAGSALNPRVRLFRGRAAGAAAAPALYAHPTDIPYWGGLDLWAEGATTSGAMRDTELRLRVTDAEGYADHAAITVHTLRVQEIYFHGIRNIYYARIPDFQTNVPNVPSYILPPALVAARTPVTPEAVRPAAGTPHWRRQGGATDNAEFSWPAAYVRRGASNAPNARMEAIFELYPQAGNNVTMRIKARAEGAPMDSDLQSVTFANGVSNRIAFPIQQLPDTVARLDATGGWRLRWRCDGWGPETAHTLFIVDAVPRAPDGTGFLWEIFEWSCGWANGVTGRNTVFNQIWARFSPVAGNGAHATGLIYWRNHTLFPVAAAVTAQNLPAAIRSFEHGTANLQRAATCIVFDRILINACTLHGIDAAEVQLAVPVPQFNRADPLAPHPVRAWECVRWLDNNVHGQGNTAAPGAWGSHWIASVKLTSMGFFDNWYYYDPSYGVAPVDSPTPGAVNAAIDPINYEPLTVTAFDCQRVGSARRVNFPPTADPPRLTGKVLFNSA